METIALHTRLRAGMESTYDAEHAQVPIALDAALRDAGVVNWRIWRSGQDLFHVVECEDYQRMRAALREHPANIPWQQQMNRLLERADSYEGDDRGIGLVWALEGEAAA